MKSRIFIMTAFLGLFFLPVPGRTEEKKAEAKAPETKYFEVVTIAYSRPEEPDEGGPVTDRVRAEAKKFISTTAVYISGDKFRIDEYNGEGKDRKLRLTHIFKDGFEYTFVPGGGAREYQKGEAKYITENNMCESPCAGVGMKWTDVIRRDWHETSARKVVITKKANEKWNGMDCEAYRAEEKFESLIYHIYYIDLQKVVSRVLLYEYAVPGANEKDFLEMEGSLVKYESGGTFPKETFEIPEGYEDSNVVIERQQRKVIEDIRNQSRDK